MTEGKRNAIAHHVSVLLFFYFLKVKILNNQLYLNFDWCFTCCSTIYTSILFPGVCFYHKAAQLGLYLTGTVAEKHNNAEQDFDR